MACKPYFSVSVAIFEVPNSSMLDYDNCFSRRTVGEVTVTSGEASMIEGVGPEPDDASPWWWLALPVGLAVVLSFLWNISPNRFIAWAAGESGLVEVSQVVILLAAVAVALRILSMARARRDRLMTTWVGLVALTCVMIAGEELSWGQHIFGWATPSGWNALNVQGETNLHNISSWLNQKPRALLELGVLVGGIAIPLVALARPRIRRGRFGIYLPPLACLPAALIAEVVRMWDRLVIGLGGHSWLFHRSSEIQELYFYLFILFYVIILRRRLSASDQIAEIIQDVKIKDGEKLTERAA